MLPIDFTLAFDFLQGRLNQLLLNILQYPVYEYYQTNSKRLYFNLSIVERIAS